MRASLWALALAVGCAGNPAPVPVEGSPDDVRGLAGEWFGEYEGPETGRSGSIIFRLAAGRDTASGDVVMTPRGSSASLHPMHPRDVPEPAGGSAAVLGIRFVSVSGGRIAGALEPYHDPRCDCERVTTFTGQLRGDTIAGEFETAGSGMRTTHGRWRVTRRPAGR